MTKRIGTYLAVAMLASLPATMAKAEQVTFSVIGPHEYELPVNFKDFDAFVQYSGTNFSDQTFNASGNLVHSSSQDYTLGLTKLVRFITFDGLPNVGFAPEAIVPEVNLASGGTQLYGIADPIFGGATWIKPNKDSTFGFQSFIQAPIGMTKLTNNYYDNISTIFYDYQAHSWDVTGDTGGIFRSTQHQPNVTTPGKTNINTGTSFFTNLRIGYKLNQPSIPFEPFFAVDYEYDTQFKVAGSNTIAVPRMADLALGAGGVVTISDKYSLTFRYSRSVAGLNEVPTNAVYLKFVSILP